MTKIVKFSKPYNPIFKIKKNFFINNAYNLQNSIKINKFYKKQPIRKYCKNCNSKNLKEFIINFGIKYKICLFCNHLNGNYQDTEKFAEKLYNSYKGKSYAKNYMNNYQSRVKNIYLPKVNFLKQVIKKKIKILDLGCGAGHFLKALEIKKIKGIGFDTSKELCDLGNKKLRKNKIYYIKLNEIYKIIENTNKINTLSLIGVLEHLSSPEKILDSFKKSKIQFLYLSLPLFSLSTFLENSFLNVFPRQLSGGHTHLYTAKSINHLIKKYKLKIVGEYWFGTDIADLYRSLINSAKILNKKIYLNELNEKFSNSIDDLQSVLDRNKISSEVHLILKNKNI